MSKFLIIRKNCCSHRLKWPSYKSTLILGYLVVPKSDAIQTINNYITSFTVHYTHQIQSSGNVNQAKIHQKPTYLRIVTSSNFSYQAEKLHLITSSTLILTVESSQLSKSNTQIYSISNSKFATQPVSSSLRVPRNNQYI